MGLPEHELVMAKSRSSPPDRQQVTGSVRNPKPKDKSTAKV